MREINDRRPCSAATMASRPSPPTASAARCAIQPVSATRTMNTAKATKRIPIPAVTNRFSMPQSAATSSADDAAIKTRVAVSAHMQCRAGKGPRSSTSFSQEKKGAQQLTLEPFRWNHFAFSRRGPDPGRGGGPHRQKQRCPLELARRIRGPGRAAPPAPRWGLT
ncbi:MAG: hypothetical protein H6Q87_499 [candidate division NC10 bacterium]|nr:hypothetical protein [candidate division NC10 bacterium]